MSEGKNSTARCASSNTNKENKIRLEWKRQASSNPAANTAK